MHRSCSFCWKPLSECSCRTPKHGERDACGCLRRFIGGRMQTVRCERHERERHRIECERQARA